MRNFIVFEADRLLALSLRSFCVLLLLLFAN